MVLNNLFLAVGFPQLFCWVSSWGSTDSRALWSYVAIILRCFQSGFQWAWSVHLKTHKPLQKQEEDLEDLLKAFKPIENHLNILKIQISYL